MGSGKESFLDKARKDECHFERFDRSALNMTATEAMTLCLDMGEDLTQSKMGFFHFFDRKRKMIKLVTWSSDTLKECALSKASGTDYPMALAGIWVNCLTSGKPDIQNDYKNIPDSRGFPEGHIPVSRTLILPVLKDGQPVAIYGVGNKPTEYNAEDAKRLEELIRRTWPRIESLGANAE